MTSPPSGPPTCSPGWRPGRGGGGVDEYAAACATLGREVTWEPAGRGRAVAVQDDGGLVVETPAGRRVLYAGEVHTVRPVA